MASIVTGWANSLRGGDAPKSSLTIALNRLFTDLKNVGQPLALLHDAAQMWGRIKRLVRRVRAQQNNNSPTLGDLAHRPSSLSPLLSQFRVQRPLNEYTEAMKAATVFFSDTSNMQRDYPLFFMLEHLFLDGCVVKLRASLRTHVFARPKLTMSV